MPRGFRQAKLKRGTHYRGNRSGAAKTIQSAWRTRKRKQFGLNTRTTLANRRAIKTLKKAREVKSLETIQATLINNFGGQYLRSTAVDINGQDTTGANLVLKPTRGLVQGLGPHDRIGNDVKMRRVTFKFYIEAPTAALAPIVEEYNEVCVLICLDTAPNTVSAPMLGGGNSGSLLTGTSPNPMLKYYEEKNIGKTKRYRPLYRKVVRISPIQGGVVGYLQSSPYPPFARWSHTVKAPYKLEYGQAAGLQTYCQNQELICFFFSDSAALPHPSVSCFCKYSFIDP